MTIAHLTLLLLVHYLVKCRSRSLAVYNNEWNEFILGSACRLRKSLWDHIIIQICYSFNINQERVYRTKISDVDEQRVGRSESPGYWMCCWRLASASTCLRSCWRRTFWVHAVIKMMWCDTYAFLRDHSDVCRHSVNHSNVQYVQLIIALTDSIWHVIIIIIIIIILLRKRTYENKNKWTIWNKICKTRMRGKAQPDGRPALQIIKTPFLYFSPLLDQSTRATPLFG